MITKKDLQERFGISLNTVRKTLEACGLDTSKSEYTEEEIRDRFEVARTMLTDEQKNYAEVAAHFGASIGSEAEPTPRRPVAQAEKEHIKRDPLQQAIRENVEGYVQEVTDEAMEEVIAHLPQMIYNSAQKLVKTGAVDEVFQNMMAQRRAFAREFSHDGTTIDVPVGGLPFVDDDEEGDNGERQWEPQG
jgi:hypothetical protein